MWVIYVEMGVAFALLILIVWWTLPTKRKGGPDPSAKQERAREEELP